MTITIYSNPLRVDPDPAYVSKSGGDVVQWQHAQNLHFCVDFGGPDSGPFINHHFQMGDQTGPARGNATIGTPYKYTVTVAGGEPPLDPIIIVR
jgi:hypothetical protein